MQFQLCQCPVPGSISWTPPLRKCAQDMFDILVVLGSLLVVQGCQHPFWHGIPGLLQYTYWKSEQALPPQRRMSHLSHTAPADEVTIPWHWDGKPLTEGLAETEVGWTGEDHISHLVVRVPWGPWGEKWYPAGKWTGWRGWWSPRGSLSHPGDPVEDTLTGWLYQAASWSWTPLVPQPQSSLGRCLLMWATGKQYPWFGCFLLSQLLVTKHVTWAQHCQLPTVVLWVAES